MNSKHAFLQSLKNGTGSLFELGGGVLMAFVVTALAGCGGNDAALAQQAIADPRPGVILIAKARLRDGQLISNPQVAGDLRRGRAASGVKVVTFREVLLSDTLDADDMDRYSQALADLKNAPLLPLKVTKTTETSIYVRAGLDQYPMPGSDAAAYRPLPERKQDYRFASKDTVLARNQYTEDLFLGAIVDPALYDTPSRMPNKENGDAPRPVAPVVKFDPETGDYSVNTPEECSRESRGPNAYVISCVAAPGTAREYGTRTYRFYRAENRGADAFRLAVVDICTQRTSNNMSCDSRYFYNLSVTGATKSYKHTVKSPRKDGFREYYISDRGLGVPGNPDKHLINAGNPTGEVMHTNGGSHNVHCAWSPDRPGKLRYAFTKTDQGIEDLNSAKGCPIKDRASRYQFPPVPEVAANTAEAG